jgi:hypothetical protein
MYKGNGNHSRECDQARQSDPPTSASTLKDSHCISASNLSQCPPTHFSTFSKLSRGKNPGIPFSLTYSAVDEVEGIFGVRF